MYDSINQRIKSIIENSGMSLTAYAKCMGIAQTSLRDCVVNGSEPSAAQKTPVYQGFFIVGD